MLREFEKKLADFTKANELFGSADKVLLAVSGGADSTALLYATHALKAENVLNAKLVCAHINHRLRAVEADLDEKFVVAQATRLKLAVTTKRLDVRRFARC
ncbi:MAG: ATP-binding protein, partial [Planctomycetota bacterium]